MQLTINAPLSVEMNLWNRNCRLKRKNARQLILFLSHFDVDRLKWLLGRHEGLCGHFKLNIFAISSKWSHKHCVVGSLDVARYCMALEAFTMVEETS